MEDIRDDVLISESGTEILVKSELTEIDRLSDTASDGAYLHGVDISSIGLEMAEAFKNADFDLAYELLVRRWIRSPWSTIYQYDEGSEVN